METHPNMLTLLHIEQLQALALNDTDDCVQVSAVPLAVQILFASSPVASALLP